MKLSISELKKSQTLLYLTMIIPLLIFIGVNVYIYKHRNSIEYYTDKKTEFLNSDISLLLKISEMPLHCVDIEYPNKTSHTYTKDDGLTTPKALHPAFYGCFDWHSCVHGYASMVKILKIHPNIQTKDDIISKLKTHITKENILKELEYFKKNKIYERTYGWAWLLKLAEELYTWDTDLGRELYDNIKPLSDFLSESFIDYLNILSYPIRVGTHNNTAFSMALSFDYAKVCKKEKLLNTIIEKSLLFFEKDKEAPYKWEPDGTDFLSPSLSEAWLLSKVMEDKKTYKEWLSEFLPDIKFYPEKYYKPIIIKDRSDYQLVHLEGLKISRCMMLYDIGEKINSKSIKEYVKEEIEECKKSIFETNYGGSHWLGTYLLYTLY